MQYTKKKKKNFWRCFDSLLNCRHFRFGHCHVFSLNLQDCSLHLHLSSSRKYGITPPLSEENAPGIIMAHGICVFLSVTPARTNRLFFSLW